MNVTLSLFAGVGAQFLDNNGKILSGGLIYTYNAGTTTPLETYTSNLGTVTQPNPIILDSAGRIPTGELWLSTGFGYKFVVKDSNSVLIGSYDNVPSSAQPLISNDASSIYYELGTTVTAGSFIVGLTYCITSVGSTNFQAIGASANQVGVHFIATGVGSGNGTAQISRTVQNTLQSLPSLADFNSYANFDSYSKALTNPVNFAVKPQSTIRTLASKLQDVVSVKDFGAVGDGVTDDTIAIQAALDLKLTTFSGISAPANVYFPAGTYLVTSTIQVPNNVSIYGEGSSSIIRGNFAGAVLAIGVLSAVARGYDMVARDLTISSGVFCDYGIIFRGIVRSNFSNLYVISDNPCSSIFAAFRFGGEVYTNTFTGLKANIINDPGSANGIGFHIGNDFNAWSSIYAATNDNIFTGCASNSFNIGFLLDVCGGTKLYGCNAEKGSSYAVKILGGAYNNVYNFWSEQSAGYYWGTANKQNGSGGTTSEASTYCGVHDTALIGANFVMDSGFTPTFTNAYIGGVCTIATAVENALVRDVTYAGGFVPATAITDGGKSSFISYRDNGYGDYTQIINTGAAGASQGFKLQASGSSTILTNLYSAKNITFQAFDGSISTNAIWRPSTDNTLSLGTGANRWSVVYAGTGSINTSDERQKQDIKDLSALEKEVAIKIKGLIKSFKFKDAVAKKGNKARIHFGVMAQQVAEAFKVVGLNPDEYGLFCYDKWNASEEIVNDKGEVITEARKAGDSYGVRYDELLAFVISAL